MYLLFVNGSLFSDCPEDGGGKLFLKVVSSMKLRYLIYQRSRIFSSTALKTSSLVERLRWTTKLVNIARNLRCVVGLLFRNLRLEFVRQRRWNRLLGKWRSVPLQVAAVSHNNADLQNMFVLFSAPPPPRRPDISAIQIMLAVQEGNGRNASTLFPSHL